MPPSTRSTRSRSVIGASPGKSSTAATASKKKNNAAAAAAAAPASPPKPKPQHRAKSAARKNQSAPAAAAPTKKASKTTSTSNSTKTPLLPLFLLLSVPRLLSAATNIIHDCDEVFNYWEPLHFVLFGSGMQTWEYSPRFALRPWLYLALHGAVAAPAAAVSRAAFGLGLGASKRVAFHAVRVALALLSAAAEARLCAAAGDVLGGGNGNGNGSGSGGARKKSSNSASKASSSPRLLPPPVSLILAFLLATSAGMFSAAPALLPSSFVMLFLTWAAAEVLKGDKKSPNLVVAAGVFGLLWGWPVASVAFFPYALWVLFATDNLLKTAAVALGLSVLALTPLVLLDWLAYGKLTLSLLNFLKYNVSGDGGDSSLYGVEDWHYYLRNSVLNLGVVVALAAAAPVVLGVVFLATRAKMISSNSSTAMSVSTNALKRLALTLLPLPLWSVTISSLPHKEERFLYPVYPLACLAAAATTAAAPAAVAAFFAPLKKLLLPRSRPSSSSSSSKRSASFYSFFSVVLQASLVLFASAVGVSRVAALLASYSAPLGIYLSLPSDPVPPPPRRSDPDASSVEEEGETSSSNTNSLVCLGAEWHRFPSSFLLPGEAYRLGFVSAGFGGLLPVPFDSAKGGTRAAPDSLNDRNARDERNELANDAACDYFVGVAPPSGDARQVGRDWSEVASSPFLDVNAAAVRALPALSRAFYLPRWFAAGVLRRPSWAAEEGLLKERARYVLMKRNRNVQRGAARIAGNSAFASD